MSRSLLVQHASAQSKPRHSALLAKGFRPFFLLAGAFAVVAVPLWLLVLQGRLVAPAYLDPATFHAHEMLHGYAVAVLAGFLLTAVGNWTQRETATGAPLLALTLLWVAGRVAMLMSAALPVWLTATIDLSFLPTLGVVLARPLLATRNRRNFVMLGVLAALWLSNAAAHAEALGQLAHGAARRANLTALNAVVLVMSLMAARIFPMFTKNATGVPTIHSSPRLDRAALAAFLVALLLDAAWPTRVVTGFAFAAAGILTALRSVSWGGRHSLRDPLLWVLHVGHAWLVLGLSLRAAALLGAPELGMLATHALTVGALGGLTLGMMARVALGHTGRMLAAPGPMGFAFLAINLAALVRCFGPLLLPGSYPSVLLVSGGTWALAFTVFVVTYTPLLLQPRVDGRPG